MLGSAIFYGSLAVAAIGAAALVRPVQRLGLPTRKRAAVVATGGLAAAIVALFLPAFDERAAAKTSRLDEFVPVWQFNEVHSIRIAAPPPVVFAAIRAVRADEITLFRTLTWIRRFGQPLPPGVLNAGNREGLLDVAVKGGFVWLANDPPHEVVVGAVIVAPRGPHRTTVPVMFRENPGPGFVLAAMNFTIAADGQDRSLVTTETRVFASSSSVRRRFAAYWRVIYPGSAIIRRMWLRAIERRAITAGGGFS